MAAIDRAVPVCKPRRGYCLIRLAAFALRHRVWAGLASLMFAVPLLAAVLPEDRFDALYHNYDGGGVKINGPSIMLRKLLGSSVSVFGNHYVDAISSASIDVVTTASPYTEKRTEQTFGADYLHDKTTMSLAYTTSEENDYSAETASFNISQDFFGDLTTLTMGFTRGWDVVGQRGAPAFAEDADHRRFRVGLTQVLTKNAVANLSYESVADGGFLRNPYRQVRFVDSAAAKGYSYEAENYPQTHTSHAGALRGLYYLPYRASVQAGYRFYADNWGIAAHTAEIGYTHPLASGWIFEVNYRAYQQTRADFYSDLFPYAQAQNYRARDKELSAFNSQTVGLGVTYEFARGGWGFIDKGSVNLAYDRIQFNYDDFRDLRTGAAVGREPLYSFAANVLQCYLSIWY